jgi:acyl-CoA synthetase (AMP-forming)/AMP-acid ligase II
MASAQQPQFTNGPGHPATASESSRWGEAVKAVVEPNAGFKIDPAEIITFCRETLGGVKTPKTVEVWDLLPRNANGKVLKRQIRDQFWLGRRRAV